MLPMGERMPSLDSRRKSDSDSAEPLWHSIPLDDVFSNLNTTVDGLSTEEVIRRRETYGENKLLIITHKNSAQTRVRKIV